MYSTVNKTIIFNQKDLSYISEGEEATIYRYHNIALKIYKNPPKKRILSPLEIDYLKTIPTQRIALPIEKLLTDDNQFCGYIMPFIDGNQTNIYNLPKRQLIHELNKIKLDLIKLSQKEIVISDLRYSNFLCTQDKIYLVDCGDYYRDSFIQPSGNTNLRIFNQFFLKDIIGSYIANLDIPVSCKKKVYRQEKYTANQYSNITDYYNDVFLEEDTIASFLNKKII